MASTGVVGGGKDGLEGKCWSSGVGVREVKARRWMRMGVPFGFWGVFDEVKERDWCEIIQLKRHGHGVQCTAME